jgi:hypothetical protein
MTSRRVSSLLLAAVLAALAIQGTTAAPVAASPGNTQLPQTGVITAAGAAGPTEGRQLLGSNRCSLNGRFFEHFAFFGSLQCCEGSWHHGSCDTYRGGSGSSSGGSCAGEGHWYPSYSWYNGFQCCSGSWRHGGCDSSHRSDSWGSSSSSSSSHGSGSSGSRKLLGGSFRQCSLNGRHFEHFVFFGSLQCCDGSWHHGSCSNSGYNSGSCSWEGQWYPSYGWYNGFQCCSGSWRHGGCDSGSSSSGSSSSSGYRSGSSDRCQWDGQWYPSQGWYNGFQCCSGGSWRKGGCSS